MADDKSKTAGQDQAYVAGGGDYDVYDLAEKFGITSDQVLRLIDHHGNDRETFEREARKLKG
jgi:hypothetical protein